tara:strand:- start:989 stop:1318 length:330 start_codon:yes stop_codon:yes gene_type:complete
MIWPPVKAWTSSKPINGHFHFVAINYGGELLKRWVTLMSVLDSSVTVKVPWSQLADSSNWVPGWDEINYEKQSKLVNKATVKNIEIYQLSIDSGLTIPISKDSIRPWFN